VAMNRMGAGKRSRWLWSMFTDRHSRSPLAVSPGWTIDVRHSVPVGPTEGEDPDREPEQGGSESG